MVGIGREAAAAGPRRGDIHFVDFLDQGGQVIRGPHPALVIQTTRLQRSSTVIVAPMTSSARAAEYAPPFLVPVAARDSGLPRDGWIKCDQPTTLPTTLLGPRVGRLNPDALERLEVALRFVLDLGA
ncbi:MAG: type II toxin-antitoxin system PemK/MazF family toxin [Chloroflexota bacterium]